MAAWGSLKTTNATPSLGQFSENTTLFYYIPLYDLEYWLDVCVLIQYVNQLQLLLRWCQDEDHLILQNEVIQHLCLHHFLHHDFRWFSDGLHDDLRRFQNSDVPSCERFVSIFVHLGEVLELKIFLDSWQYLFLRILRTETSDTKW